MVKDQQKVSGCFRAVPGGEAFCRLRGYLSTLTKQGHNLLDALTALCEGTPLWPCLQPG
jgi:transposase